MALNVIRAHLGNDLIAGSQTKSDAISRVCGCETACNIRMGESAKKNNTKSMVILERGLVCINLRVKVIMSGVICIISSVRCK
jgi:hypothetical protein